MNKVEMIEKIAEKTGLSKKDSGCALNAVIETITETMAAGEKITLPGFGSFDVKVRAERKGRNPKTKEEITIPSSKLPTFKAGRVLKDAVSN